MPMMVMIRCEECDWIWTGDPYDEECPHCGSTDFYWSAPDDPDEPY